MARAKIKGELGGTAELRRKLKEAGRIGTKALAAAAIQEMERVIGDAKLRTPVDLGTLKGSGTVLMPKIRGKKVTIIGGFGGAAKEYALRVHEDLSLSHTVGEAKFLERAWMERLVYMDENLARHAAKALERLQGR